MPDQFWRKNIAEMVERYGEFDPKHVGPRVKFPTREPKEEGYGTSHGWVRVVYGWPYHFNFVVMPDGEKRLFVSKYNGYIGGVRFGCAWSPVRSYVYPVSGEVRISSSEPKHYDHGYDDVLEEWDDEEPGGPCMCGQSDCEECNPGWHTGNEPAFLDMPSYGM